MNRNTDQNSWKTLAYVAGGAIGLITGLLAARMYTQSAEANNAVGNAPMKLEPSQLFPIGLALVALVRQASELGANKPEAKR